ncbi:hypothetical protein ACKAV7_005761 [Fusarium commune]
MKKPATDSQDRACTSITVSEGNYVIQQDQLEKLVQSYRASNDPDLLEEVIQTARKSYKEVIEDFDGLEEAMKLERKAIEASPSDSMDRQRFSYWLALQLGDYFYHIRNLDDADEAIGLIKSSLEKFPDESPIKAAHMANLGILLKEKYSVLGVEDDFGSGCESLETAIASSPEDQNTIATWLEKLADFILEKVDDKRLEADLEESVSYARTALEVTPSDCPSSYIQLYNLGSMLLKRFSRNQEDVSDLNQGIALLREALTSISSTNPEIESILSHLASALDTRHDKLRKAIAVMGNPFVERPTSISTLAALLKKRFRAGGSLDDMIEAILISQKTLESMPEDSPFRTDLWTTLGDLFAAKFGRTWATSDLEEAVHNYRCAVEHPTGNTLRRIIAATSVMPLCLSLQDAYDIGRTAIDLVPGIAAARSLETSDRQHLLSYSRGLAASVTCAAIRLKRDPSEALAILEQGRGILGSSLDDLRTDTKELHEEFGEDPGSRRRNAAKSFDGLLNEIPKSPGFEDFLGRLTTDQIRAAATYGPIVIINSSWMGCEGIVIERERITSMIFKDLDDGELMERAEGFDLGTPDMLEWLWDTITGRVLEALGFTETPPNQQEWPHVWWMPTGPLSRFPLHASG